jgi:hypothetical protein
VIRAEAPASILPAWHGNHFWKAEVRDAVVPQLNSWTEHLYNAVSTDGENLVKVVPRNIQHFCPNFKDLDREERIAFWVRLISVMAGYESSYNFKTTFKEPSSGVLSSGLMQMSVNSVQLPHYDCSMISDDDDQAQKDLFDPKKNLSCAVRIINHWVGRDGTIVEFANNANGVEGDEYWQGLARYWGVFRHKRIKSGPDEFWAEIKGRHERWQEWATRRDTMLMAELKEANEKDKPWTNRDWEAQNSSTPHPSLLESQYDDEEAHPLTSILRQINQTSFCYR